MRIIRLLRAVFRIPQRELAERSGISVRELVRIESGESAPTRAHLAALDQAMDRIVSDRAKGSTDESSS